MGAAALSGPGTMMVWRFFSVGGVVSISLFVSSVYMLLRVKNVPLPFRLPDDFMVAALAVLGILGAVYIFLQNLRRDAVRTLL